MTSSNITVPNNESLNNAAVVAAANTTMTSNGISSSISGNNSTNATQYLYLRQLHDRLPIPFTVQSQLTSLTSPLRQRKFLRSDTDNYLGSCLLRKRGGTTGTGSPAAAAANASNMNTSITTTTTAAAEVSFTSTSTTTTSATPQNTQSPSPLQGIILPQPHLSLSTMQPNELTVVSLGTLFKGKTHKKKYVIFESSSLEGSGEVSTSSSSSAIRYVYMVDYKALRKWKDRLYEVSIEKSRKGPRFVIKDISPGTNWKEMSWKDSTPSAVLEKMVNARLKTKERDRLVDGSEFFGLETEIVRLALQEWYDLQQTGEKRFQGRDAEEWMNLLVAHEKKLTENINFYEERLQLFRSTLQDRERNHGKSFSKPKFTPPVMDCDQDSPEDALLNEDLLQSNSRRNHSRSKEQSQQQYRSTRRNDDSHHDFSKNKKPSAGGKEDEKMHTSPSPKKNATTSTAATATAAHTSSPSQLLDELSSTDGPSMASNNRPPTKSTPTPPQEQLQVEETPQRKRSLLAAAPRTHLDHLNKQEFKRPHHAAHRSSTTSIDMETAFLSPIDHVGPKRTIETSRSTSKLLSSSRKRKSSPSTSPNKPLKKKRMDESPNVMEENTCSSSSSDEATPEKLSQANTTNITEQSIGSIPPLDLEPTTQEEQFRPGLPPSPCLDEPSFHTHIHESTNHATQSERRKSIAKSPITADDLLNTHSVPEGAVFSSTQQQHAPPSTNNLSRTHTPARSSTTSMHSPELFSEDGGSQRVTQSRGTSSPDLFSEDENHSEASDDIDTQESHPELHPSTAPTQSPQQHAPVDEPIFDYSNLSSHPIMYISKDHPVSFREKVSVHAENIEHMAVSSNSVMVAVCCGRTEVLVYRAFGKHLKLRHRLRKSGEEYLGISFTPDDLCLVIHGRRKQGKTHFLRFTPLVEEYEKISMEKCVEIVESNDRIVTFNLLHTREDTVISLQHKLMYSLGSKKVKQCQFNNSWTKKLCTTLVGYSESVVDHITQVRDQTFCHLVWMQGGKDICLWDTNDESLKVYPCKQKFEEIHSFVSGQPAKLILICVWTEDNIKKFGCFTMEPRGLEFHFLYDINMRGTTTPVPSLYENTEEGMMCLDVSIIKESSGQERYYLAVGTKTGLVYLMSAVSGSCLGILKDHLSAVYQPSAPVLSSALEQDNSIKACLFHRTHPLLFVATSHSFYVYVEGE